VRADRCEDEQDADDQQDDTDNDHCFFALRLIFVRSARAEMSMPSSDSLS
jgi:hypothetical protein